MTTDDLEEVIESIFYRNDRRWCTPSGAFLDLVRRFAGEGKIGAIPEACQLYFGSGQHADQAYVASALPAIIVNNYRPFTDGISFSRFIAWTKRYPNWSDQIRDNVCSKALVLVVNQMTTSLQKDDTE